MIYIKSFKNYDEFKQVFGVVEHGNGVKSRKNKILLACLKDRKLLKWWLAFKKQWVEHGKLDNTVYAQDYLGFTNMDELKGFAKFMLRDATCFFQMWNSDDANWYCLNFGNFPYRLFSKTLRLDQFKGLCTDGDTRAVRYVNTERDDRVFKMKAGKLVSKCIEGSCIADVMPEQLKRWIGEEFAREWQSYAASRVDHERYTLHVDDNFAAIYDSDMCRGDFGSCMTDKDNWRFYRDSIRCKAAYLTDEDGYIVARCIVYSDVTDGCGDRYRLAERQYSSGQDNVLKQILVDMLIKEGEIDGYKRVGADCHDNKNFVTNDGTSMRDMTLQIDCCLDYGDALSYQDSFVYYDKERGIAYNDSDEHHTHTLDSTDGRLEGESDWSEYNQCYIDEDEATYDEYYDDYCYDSQVQYAIYDGRIIQINGEMADCDGDWNWSESENAYIYCDESCYVGEKLDWFPKDKCEWSEYYGRHILKPSAVYCEAVNSYILSDDSVKCPSCGKLLPFDHDDVVYSDITDEWYCSDECLKEAERKYREEHALVLTA